MRSFPTPLVAARLALGARSGATPTQRRHGHPDGTKPRANASKRNAISYARMTEKEKILAAEVSALLAEAERIDKAEVDLQNAKHPLLRGFEQEWGMTTARGLP